MLLLHEASLVWDTVVSYNFPNPRDLLQMREGEPSRASRVEAILKEVTTLEDFVLKCPRRLDICNRNSPQRVRSTQRILTNWEHVKWA